MIRINIGFCTIVGALLLTTFSLQGQTKKDAADAYNQGVATMSTNVDSAIIYFERSVELSDKVGSEAMDVHGQATKVLPGLYYKKVISLAKDRKIPEALAASKDAIKASEKYNNENIKEETLKIMVQIYFSMGNNYFSKMNDNENAIKAYDSALVINPNYTKALYNKALVYRKMEMSDKFVQTIDLAITKAEGDTSQIAIYNKAAREYFRNSGVKANLANKLPEALEDLTTAQKYGAEKDIYYQFANIYNKQKKYDEALSNATKGLELETGPNDAKAKYHYEIAVAQLGKGEKEAACASFKSAQYGAFITAAKAQMTNMKCGGAGAASGTATK